MVGRENLSLEIMVRFHSPLPAGFRFILFERVIIQTTSTMSTLMTTLGDAVTPILGWVADVCSTIVGTPLLLMTTGFLVLGGAVGIFGRLLSRG